MMEDVLSGGFENPAAEAARAFRVALDAMARPGRIATVAGARPPMPLSVAAGTLLLVLTDRDTPLFLAPSHDRGDIRDWISFHTGAPFVPPREAGFALGAWPALQPASRFAIGRPDYPDRSATLIVEMAALTPEGARLTGPGIADSHRLSLPEIAAFRANRALFPQGFDCFFTAGDTLAALPRSTIVEEA